MAKGLRGAPPKRREVQWVGIGRLDLDPLNPRLPDGMALATQDKLLAVLAAEYDLSEIGQSIADNGYFSEEPLVTVPAKGDHFVVVEGNRRLAALKLLDKPQSAPAAYRKRWLELSDQRTVQVIEVPILVYDSRKQLILIWVSGTSPGSCHGSLIPRPVT